MTTTETTSLAMIQRLRQLLPARWQHLAVMASPPTVTMSAANVNSLNYNKVTNGATASGNNVLHFASDTIIAGLVPGMLIQDFSTFGVIPANTYVVSATATTVTMSKNATGGGVGNGDTIVFTGKAWPALTEQSTANTSIYGAWSLSGAAGPVVSSPTFFPTAIQWSNVNYGGGTQKFNTASISFDYYGSGFNIAIVGQANAGFNFKINDQYVSATPQSVVADGNFYYLNVRFSTPQWARIEILLPASALFVGVWTGPQDVLLPAPLKGPKCVVVGDSWTEGSGATAYGSSSWAQRMFEFLGWNNFIMAGVGGTGLMNTFGSSPNYLTRIATDVIPYKPDIVIIQGSQNDVTGAFTPAQMAAQINNIYHAITAQLPKCIVVFTSGGVSAGPTGTAVLRWTQKAAMKAAAIAAGAYWIDWVERPFNYGYVPLTHTLSSNTGLGVSQFNVSGSPPLVGGTYSFADGTRFLCTSVSGTSSPYTITTEATGLQNAQTGGATITQVGDCPWTGTGKNGSAADDGSCDVLVYSDGVHPTQISHDMIGFMTAADLSKILSAI